MPCNSPCPSSPSRPPPAPTCSRSSSSAPPLQAFPQDYPSAPGCTRKTGGGEGGKRNKQGNSTAEGPPGAKNEAWRMSAAPVLSPLFLPSYLHAGEWCRIAQVRTASTPEVSSSERINAGMKKMKRVEMNKQTKIINAVNNNNNNNGDVWGRGE